MQTAQCQITEGISFQNHVSSVKLSPCTKLSESHAITWVRLKMDFAHATGVSIFQSFMMDIIHLILVVIELKVEAIL